MWLVIVISPVQPFGGGCNHLHILAFWRIFSTPQPEVGLGAFPELD
jgi:hypothetical protein